MKKKINSRKIFSKSVWGLSAVFFGILTVIFSDAEGLSAAKAVTDKQKTITMLRNSDINFFIVKTSVN